MSFQRYPLAPEDYVGDDWLTPKVWNRQPHPKAPPPRKVRPFRLRPRL